LPVWLGEYIALYVRWSFDWAAGLRLVRSVETELMDSAMAQMALYSGWVDRDKPSTNPDVVWPNDNSPARCDFLLAASKQCYPRSKGKACYPLRCQGVLLCR